MKNRDHVEKPNRQSSVSSLNYDERKFRILKSFWEVLIIMFKWSITRKNERCWHHRCQSFGIRRVQMKCKIPNRDKKSRRLDKRNYIGACKSTLQFRIYDHTSAHTCGCNTRYNIGWNTTLQIIYLINNFKPHFQSTVLIENYLTQVWC